MGILSRMIPTEDASARKREIEEKLKQVRKERQEAGGTSLLGKSRWKMLNLC